MADDAALQARLPPHDANAERSVLGAMLRDNRLIPDVVAIIRGASFYNFGHQKLFNAITGLVLDENTPADPVTVFNWLRDEGHVDDLRGGPAYIVELWDAAPAGNAVHYAKIVRGFAIKRALVHIGNEIAALGMEPGEWGDALDDAEKKLYKLSSKCRGTEVAHFSKAIGESMQRIEDRSKRAETDTGYRTGWESIDKIIGCFDEGDLVIVGARTSVGKTAFMMNLVVNMARGGLNCYISSLEQGAIELGDRVLAALAPVNSRVIRSGQIGMDAEAILSAADRASSLPIWYDDSPDQGVMDVVANMRRMKTQNDVRICVIDYLQLIEPDDKRLQRNEQVAQITRRLKKAAREIGVVCILLAQLNREADSTKGDGRPKLTHLRESGNIEQDADIVFLLHADAENELQLEVIVAKDRKGMKGSAMLAFDKATSRIIEWEVKGIRNE
jgi:replicative DNA helicase